MAAGADYVDLCGEPEFIDRMQLKFGVPAVLAGVLVVHACAFDSVPADVGCLFTALQFAPPARCAHAMMYHTADWPAGVKGAAGHATTFFAAVHGFANVGATRRQRKELLAALEARVPGSTKEAPAVGPKLRVATGPTWVAKLAKYAFRFPGADVAVVRTSQRTLHSLGGSLAADGGKDGTKQFLLPQFGAAFCVTSTMSAWMVAATGALFNFLAARAWGRSLLLRFPQTLSAGAFSHEGPSEEMLAKSTFRTVFFGAGYSDGGAAGGAFDRRVTCSVSGPEPGYIATALMFGAMARTLLDDRAGLGLKGGVFTPGALVGGGARRSAASSSASAPSASSLPSTRSREAMCAVRVVIIATLTNAATDCGTARPTSPNRARGAENRRRGQTALCTAGGGRGCRWPSFARRP